MIWRSLGVDVALILGGWCVLSLAVLAAVGLAYGGAGLLAGAFLLIFLALKRSKR